MDLTAGAFGVPAEQRVPANHDEIAEHPQAVAEYMDVGSCIVRPTDRHFGRAQTVALRQEQNFWIEAEAFDALLLEDNARALPHEGFKSALRIVKAADR